MFKRETLIFIMSVMMFTLTVLFMISIGFDKLAHAESSITPHNDNFIIAGADDVKFNISIKYNIFYPFTSGVYFAYSETAFWDIYKKSGPFREFNHNPEVFYMLEQGNNIFGNSDLFILDHITLAPYEHKSNGRDGIYSRSIDRCYGEIQLSYGDTWNIGTRVKGFYYYKKSKKNYDIEDYTGHGECELFVKRIGKDNTDLTFYKFYIKGGLSDEYDKGWGECGVIVPILCSNIQPRLFINLFHGYGESLVDYNKKDTMIRAGIMFL